MVFAHQLLPYLNKSQVVPLQLIWIE